MATVAPARQPPQLPTSRRPPPAAGGGPSFRPVFLVEVALAASSVATIVPAILPLFDGGGRTALLVAALLPVLVAGAALTRARPVPTLLRLLGYGVAGAVLLALLPGGALSGLGSGGARLVTGSLPAPASGPGFGVAVAATYVASVIAVEAAYVGRVLGALAPAALLLAAALLVGAGGLAQPRWVGALYVVAAALAVLVHQLLPPGAAGRPPGPAGRAGPPRPGSTRGGPARSGPPAPVHLAPVAGAGPALALRALVGVAIGAAVALLALPLAGRLPGAHARPPYDLRAVVAPAPRPVDQSSLLATFSSVYDESPRPVFTADVAGADAGTLYWRLATFDQFDGLEWTSSQVFQRAGTRLPVGPTLDVRTETVGAVIHPQSLPGYLPAPDRPQDVSDPGLGVSLDSGELLLPAGIRLPEAIRVTSVVPDPTAGELLESGATPGPTNPGAPGVPPALTSLARTLEAGSGPNPFARLTALSDYLTSSPFRLHPPGDSPIGAGYYQATQLLTTHTGSSEQYAAAFAILARAMGFHARLAVGYIGGTSRGDGSVAFTTRDLTVWPEVQLAGIGWQPLPADPPVSGLGAGANGSRSSPASSPPPTTQVQPSQARSSQARSAPPPSRPPSSQLGEALQQQRQINLAPRPSAALPGAPARPGSPGAAAPSGGGGSLPAWAWAAIAMGAVAVLSLGAVVTGKALRRRRQHRRSDPAARLAGAWEHTLDRLAEHRLRLPASLTAPEVADAAAVSVGPAAGPLRDLAAAIDAARYDRRQQPAPDAVEQGWAIARQVGAALYAGAPLRARARAALSVAPFTRAGSHRGGAA